MTLESTSMCSKEKMTTHKKSFTRTCSVPANNFLVHGFRLIRLQPCLSLSVCMLLCLASITDAFSVSWADGPHSRQQAIDELQDNLDLEDYHGDHRQQPSYNGSDAEDEEEEEPSHHVDQYINVLKRWGHQSRFPWKRLRGGMCFRQPCKRDKECCKRYSICDRSAKVCVDCWYGSICKTERDCCMKYPYCARVWKKTNGKRYIQTGKCVSKL